MAAFKQRVAQNIGLLQEKTTAQILCGILSLFRIKWAIVNIAALITASLMLTSSNLSIVGNYFRSTRERSENSSSDTPVPHDYSPDKPYQYPWYKHTAGPIQLWNFAKFWEQVHQPDPLSDAHLYVIHNGSLYGWRQHQEKYKVKRSERIKQYEELLIAALAQAKRDMKNDSGHILDHGTQNIGAMSMPFFLDKGDFGSCKNYTYPIVTFATFVKEKPGEACLPLGIPSYDLWNKYKSMNTSSWYTKFSERNKQYPWKTKIDRAVWRGAATGHVSIDQNWRDLPRAKLVQFSLDKPELLDAGFNSFSQRNVTVQQEIRASAFIKETMKMEDFQKFKAIVDIDGNSWSSRFSSLLCMNSVVIKIKPEMVDYSYFELQPWLHYLPVKEDLSDLGNMINLATSQQAEEQKQVQKIVKNANKWCQRKLTRLQMVLDMRWIMTSHFEILQFDDRRSGNFTKWRDNYFFDNGLWNNDKWVKII